MFVAVAYRWGWTNAHWYLVAGGAQCADIVKAARQENEDRGGKYGVAVFRMPGTARGQVVLEAYFPSLHGETAPQDNTRIVVFQRLGQKVFHAVEEGTAALPDAHDGGVLAQVPVDVPEWLRSEKRRIEAFERAVATSGAHGGQHTAG